MTNVLVRPLITEKSLTYAARGWYTFLVALLARKEDAARQIGAFYKVTVVDIRSSRMHGKMRRVGKKMKYSKKPDTKKVMVRLLEGQKIDAFEVTAPAEEKPRRKVGIPTEASGK
jgi:large subunit ribosomal protein L23